jgi:hypothetical protein
MMVIEEALMMRAAFGLLLVSVMMVAPAWAQSETGVSAALVGDIIRHSGSRDVFGAGSRDGEELGFSLRLDRALGTRWGVELEYVRGGEIESESSLFPALATELGALTSLTSSSFSFVSSSSLILPRQSRSTVRDRLSTVSSLAWYRQAVGGRTSLVYSAGVAFGIAESEVTYSFIGLPTQNTIPPTTSKYTSYSVNPIVGVDARISMTEHAALVPGLRVVGGNGAIIIRPSVGLRWQF